MYILCHTHIVQCEVAIQRYYHRLNIASNELAAHQLEHWYEHTVCTTGLQNHSHMHDTDTDTYTHELTNNIIA